LEHQKKTLTKDHEYSNVKSGVSMNLMSLSRTSLPVLAIKDDSLAIGEGFGIVFILAILDSN
jgi:hypothetical protein